MIKEDKLAIKCAVLSIFMVEFGRENKWLDAKPGDEWLGDEDKGAIPLQMYG